MQRWSASEWCTVGEREQNEFLEKQFSIFFKIKPETLLDAKVARLSHSLSHSLNVLIALPCACFILQSAFLKGSNELFSISQKRFHQNLMALRLPCLHGKYFALFFVEFHWQPMFVSYVLLSLPLASYKLFSRKLFTPSRRDCTLGKQKVQFRVSFRSPWFFIIRFPEHSYIVSKDSSRKQIPSVTSHNLFHSFFSFYSIIPLTFSIFSLEFSCTFPPSTLYNAPLWFKAFFSYLPQLLSLVPSHIS